MAAKIDDELVERLSKVASVDKRTVLRRLLGLPVKKLAGERLDKAIAKLLPDGILI